MHYPPAIISIFDTVFSFKEYLSAYYRYSVYNRLPCNEIFVNYNSTPFFVELLKEMFDGGISLETPAAKLNTIKILVGQGLPVQNALELRRLTFDSLMATVSGYFPFETVTTMQRSMFDITLEYNLMVSLYVDN